MLSVVILNIIKCHHYANYAVIILSVLMLRILRLNVVILSFVTLRGKKIYLIIVSNSQEEDNSWLACTIKRFTNVIN